LLVFALCSSAVFILFFDEMSKDRNGIEFATPRVEVSMENNDPEMAERDGGARGRSGTIAGAAAERDVDSAATAG
jgi:hypothetical protein